MAADFGASKSATNAQACHEARLALLARCSAAHQGDHCRGDCDGQGGPGVLPAADEEARADHCTEAAGDDIMLRTSKTVQLAVTQSGCKGNLKAPSRRRKWGTEKTAITIDGTIVQLSDREAPRSAAALAPGFHATGGQPHRKVVWGVRLGS